VNDEDEIATSKHPAVTVALKVARLAGRGGDVADVRVTNLGEAYVRYDAKYIRGVDGSAGCVSYILTPEHLMALCKPFSPGMVRLIAVDILNGTEWDDRTGLGMLPTQSPPTERD